MIPLDIIRGNSPIILAMPHSGLYVPRDIYARLNETGRELSDTDWHIDRLYNGLLPEATMVRANFHRYVVDPNRDPSGASLYPGQNTTGLCPLIDFDNTPIYCANQTPDAAEIERRRLAYHSPYHTALEAEIARVKSIHSTALLYDCHSIRSKVPYLFDGALPDFNIGSNGGRTCSRGIQDLVSEICAKAAGYTYVVNGRFKGGWTTRHYGRPDDGVHAIQMELSQINYMNETSPWIYAPRRAENVRAVLKTLLTALEVRILKGNIT